MLKKLITFIIILLIIIIGFIIVRQLLDQKAYAENSSQQMVKYQQPTTDVVASNVSEPVSYTFEANESIGYIHIPTMDLKIPLLYGDLEDDFEWAMEQGVVLDPTGGTPKSNKSTVIFGHRHYDFQALKDMEVGDDIILYLGDDVYVYEVYETEIVDETDIESVFYESNDLVLYTCYPFEYGSPYTERYVVHAKEIEKSNDSYEVHP